MNRIFYVLFLTIISAGSFAQTYPQEILPGESKTIEPGTDTLWILKDSQVKKAIASAKKLQIEEEISNELRNKIKLMEQKDLTKDSLINIYKTDRDFYMNNWKECSNDIDLLIKKQKRQKLYTRLSLVGVVVAFVTGFLIGK
ncbi:MAG: hypothetical protein U0W24_21040 [Bacteroidales bacterium]